MFDRLKCMIGIHDYESIADNVIDVKDFVSNPASFFRDHTRMVCRRCNKVFPHGALHCQGTTRTSKREL